MHIYMIRLWKRKREKIRLCTDKNLHFIREISQEINSNLLFYYSKSYYLYYYIYIIANEFE